MNKYEVEFFSICPINEVRIKYFLCITKKERIMAEDLVTHVDSYDDGIHEDIADHLFETFGGYQVLSAEHHGVKITTTRGKL